MKLLSLFKNKTTEEGSNKKKSVKSRSIHAASTRGNQKRWRPTSETISDEIAGGKRSLIRRRCKEVVENSPILSGERREFVGELVGEGIRVDFKIRNSRIERRVQFLWDQYIKRKITMDEEENLSGLVKLCLMEVFVSGEIFLRKFLNVEGIKYQVIPVHFLSDDTIYSSKTVEGDNYLNEGIEYNQVGRKVAYHFSKENKDLLSLKLQTFETQRILANEIHHIFFRTNTERRGLPLILSSIVKSRFLDELLDATLKKQLIASCFAAFTHDISSEISADQTGEGSNEYSDDSEIFPGTITNLPPNRSVTFPSPPGNQDFESLQRTTKMDIAKGLGTSYEALTSDYSQVTFSSARQGHQRKLKNLIVFRNFLLKDKIIDPIVNDFLDYLLTTGDILTKENISWDLLSQRDIIVDPAREIPSLVRELKNGLISWKEAISLRGKNPDDFIEKLKMERDQLNEAGLSLDFLTNSISDSNLMEGDGNDSQETDNSGNSGNQTGTGNNSGSSENSSRE